MNQIALLQVEPTTRCNFTCAFCSGRHMKQMDLKFSTYKKLLDQIEGLECMELQGEGEPLLHPDIFEMIRYAKEKKIQVCMISNGSLLTPEVVEKLLDSGLDCLNISVESPIPEEFYKIRGGNFTKIMDGVKLLEKRKRERNLLTPIIGFSVTVLKSTASKLTDIFTLYQSLGMDGGIAIQFLNESEEYQKHYTEKYTKEFLTKQEQLIVRRNYFRLLRKIHVNESVEHFFTKIERNVKLYGGEPGYCVWLEQALYVNCQGYVSSCVYIKDGEQFSLGNIETDGMEKILECREREREQIRKCMETRSCGHVNCEVIKKMREME